MYRAALLLFLLGLWLVPGFAVRAQDGLNLPTELYVLLNDGTLDRYGLGATGVRKVTPEEAFVLDFRVAPDGAWLAYRTQEGIFLSDLVTDEARALGDERASVPYVRGRGETIAWSPRADALAYTTLEGGRVALLSEGSFFDLPVPELAHLLWSPDGRYLAVEQEGVGTWWIFRREASEFSLVSIIVESLSATWLSLTEMVFAPPEGGLVLMDMAAGNQQTTLLDPFQEYHLLQRRSDGSLFVLGGAPGSASGQLLQLQFSAAGINVIELGSAEIEVRGTRWAPGGDLLFAFQGGVLALINPFTGDGLTLPIASAVAYGWGPVYPPRVEGQEAGANAYFVARSGGVMQVWQLPATGERALTVTPAEEDVSEYALSPAEDRITYISGGALWLHQISSGGMPVELALLGSAEAHTPAFSADGASIYYRDSSEDGAGIWRVSSEGGAPQLFLADEGGVVYTEPRVASGVPAMLLRSASSDGQTGLVLVDLVSAAVQPLGAYRDGGWLRGTELYVEGSIPGSAFAGVGVHLIDVNNLEEPPYTILPLVGGLRLLDLREVDGGGIRALVRSSDPGEVRILELSRAGDLPNAIGSAGFVRQPRVSPDGDLIIGLSGADGGLIYVETASGERRFLSNPVGVRALRWGR